MNQFWRLLCDGEDVIDPLYQAISTIGPVMMGIFFLLGVVYGIILGTKYSKAESSSERETVKKALINGIIGFVSIFLLISILYAIRGPLVDWMNGG